ncbi:hypothetical protein FVE85_8196 [Porphyridium purpureum]|uniref:Pentatricopeptide repeat-containing protein n=1 Tax=Porphyridium purpureum TaxID=35688 RepID=A0A5J4YMM4_PORPP|nr:hypothetical protein FVE85_8196 [Porphyridium purpureum]|eukprot:POR8238..scf295_9
MWSARAGVGLRSRCSGVAARVSEACAALAPVQQSPWKRAASARFAHSGNKDGGQDIAASITRSDEELFEDDEDDEDTESRHYRPRMTWRLSRPRSRSYWDRHSSEAIEGTSSTEPLGNGSVLNNQNNAKPKVPTAVVEVNWSNDPRNPDRLRQKKKGPSSYLKLARTALYDAGTASHSPTLSPAMTQLNTSDLPRSKVEDLMRVGKMLGVKAGSNVLDRVMSMPPGSKSTTEQLNELIAGSNLKPRPKPPSIPASQVRITAETLALNEDLNVALDKRVDLSRVRVILKEAGDHVPIDHRTLTILLRLAKLDLDCDSSREKLRFAVRALQRARKDGVQLSSYTVTHVLYLAQLNRRVNVVLAVKHLVQAQRRKLHDVAYKALIGHLGEVGRPELAEATFREMIAVHGAEAIDAEAFIRVIESFVSNGKPDDALRMWKELRAPPFNATIPVKADILAIGALASSNGCSKEFAEEAVRIGALYKENKIYPAVEQLHQLTTACLRAEDFHNTLNFMRWIAGGKYMMPSSLLREYFATCEQLKKQAEVMAVHRVLCNIKYVDMPQEEWQRFLRSYLFLLYDGVASGRMCEFAAMACAKLVMETWHLTDVLSASCMVYLAARTRFDGLAIELTEASHRKARPSRRMLRSFAYPALVNMCIKMDLLGDLMKLFLVMDRTDASGREVASQVAATFVRIFGRLGRPDLVRAVYLECPSEILKQNVKVSTACMYQLGMAGRADDAVALFRKMREDHPGKLSIAVYNALASVVFKNANEGALSVAQTSEMLSVMDAVLRRIDSAPKAPYELERFSFGRSSSELRRAPRGSKRIDEDEISSSGKTDGAIAKFRRSVQSIHDLVGKLSSNPTARERSAQ